MAAILTLSVYYSGKKQQGLAYFATIMQIKHTVYVESKK